jgi:NAD(P)-dependent dehydrogenase (short-subunit alcohol dehydrogenase family)
MPESTIFLIFKFNKIKIGNKVLFENSTFLEKRDCIMGRLENKVTIITGAASGMGLAAAKLFAKEGAKVVATDIAITQLTEEVSNIDGDILALELDVTSEDQLSSVCERAKKEFGKIDILINNAGVSVHRAY